MHVGVVLPQVGSDWARTSEAARWAEEVGADSVWTIDHLLGFPAERGILEAWTVMSAVAAITERVEIGCQVLCQSFRNPALLAKMAASLDVVSNGRLRMLVGAGWFDAEYEAFGFPFPSPGTRISELRETVQILKGMLNTSDAFGHDGDHFTVRDAVNLPRPVRQPFPIEVGGAGDRLLRLIAAEADGWNSPGGALPVLDDRLAVLGKACVERGRSMSDLRLSCQIVCAVGDDEAAAHPGLTMFGPQHGLVGSVDQAVQRAGELIAKGMDGFHCVLPPGSKGRACFERLVGEVRPQFS
jgi:alkanesulfonate monooxygenase SsuD/methylene tetrahydromethanopterin reductase-like flavin-dependent oxidoreductase (luciferase family)